MFDDLRQRLERLRRLGVQRGIAHLRPPEPSPRVPLAASFSAGPYPIESLVPGRVVETPSGVCYVAEEARLAGERRGHRALAECLAHSSETVSLLDRDPSLAAFDFRRAAFVDTETTGLESGTGNYPFLIGIGTFEGEAFVIRQYFMRNPAEEAAVLHLVTEQLDGRRPLVTFNGRAFDLPLLATRFALARQRPPFVGAPHLDLLPPSRRLWRERLASRSLSDLEKEILGHWRTQADIPGWLIPQIYITYVHTGDGRELARVFYHNVEDILSMVTLAAHLCDSFAGPPDRLHASEAASLGRWYEERGDWAAAEAAYRRALAGNLTDSFRRQVFLRLSLLLKHQERREEARAVWETWITSLPSDDLTPYVELAKHYEWRDTDLNAARMWTEWALHTARAWPPSPARTLALAELEHRLERLERKIKRPSPQHPPPGGGGGQGGGG
jgi:uncharacterized protein YprB with RNaseH-like and TPR domain